VAFSGGDCNVRQASGLSAADVCGARRRIKFPRSMNDDVQSARVLSGNSSHSLILRDGFLRFLQLLVRSDIGCLFR